MHFSVCGAERRWETRLLFLSALEVFIRSQFPLLSLKYCLSSLGKIYIFTTFPFEFFSSSEEVHVLILPNHCLGSHVGGGGMNWDEVEMSFYMLILTKAKRDVERCPRSALNSRQESRCCMNLGHFRRVNLSDVPRKCPQWRAPFAQQDTVGMMTSAASLGWLSVLKTVDVSVSLNACSHQSSPKTIRCSYQVGWVQKKRYSYPNPREKGLKSQAVAVKGVGGIRDSHDSRSKNTSCYMCPGAQIIIPTGNTYCGRSYCEINSETQGCICKQF